MKQTKCLFNDKSKVVVCCCNVFPIQTAIIQISANLCPILKYILRNHLHAYAYLFDINTYPPQKRQVKVYYSYIFSITKVNQ